MNILPKNSSLVVSSFYLFLDSLMFTVVGFLFWIFSSWLFPTDYVGEASALLGLMNFIIVLSTFGFYVAILRFIQNSKNPGTLIGILFVINFFSVLILSFVLYSVFIFFDQNSNLTFSLLEVLGFCMFSIFTSLFILSESILIGFQKFSQLIIRGFIFNFLRLLFLIIGISFFSFNLIFLSWGFASVISFIFSLFAFFPEILKSFSWDFLSGLHEFRKIVPYTFANYLSSLFWFGSGYILPVLIKIFLTTEETAYFSISWTIVTFLYLIPITICKSMVVQYASPKDENLRDIILNTLKLIYFLLLPALLLIILFGSQILSLYGSDYSHFGYETLFLLTISAIPISLIQISIGIFQIEQRNPSIVLFRGSAAFLAFIFIFLFLPSFHLTAFSLGWLFGHFIVSLPSLYIVVRKLIA